MVRSLQVCVVMFQTLLVLMEVIVLYRVIALYRVSPHSAAEFFILIGQKLKYFSFYSNSLHTKQGLSVSTSKAQLLLLVRVLSAVLHQSDIFSLLRKFCFKDDCGLFFKLASNT